MNLRILIFTFFIVVSNCDAQNMFQTNRIISSSTNKAGVVSKSGKLLIDTIYAGIFTFQGDGHKVLPPKENNKYRMKSNIEYYILLDTLKRSAVFDAEGNKIFGFFECEEIEIDVNTKTFVKILKEQDNSLRSYLYHFNGKQIFDQSFENIGYINNSNLIALIAEDGSNEEYYLYNIKTDRKLGPFTHFNIYNKDASPPLGMNKSAFEKYTALNLIAVRSKQGQNEKWGIIDMSGNELLPLKYDRISFIDDETQNRINNNSSDPENVIFYFSIYQKETRKNLFLDDKMNMYEYDIITNKIIKVN